MGFIIFEKHPVDLLKLTGLKNRVTYIMINQFSLIVIAIKLTSNWNFKVYVDISRYKNYYNDLSNELDNFVENNVTLEYKL